MVLYGIVRPALADHVPAFQRLSNLSPLVAKLLMSFKYNAFFPLSPRILIYRTVEVVVPSALNQTYLSLHCFPDLPFSEYVSTIFWAMTAHLLLPYFFTNSVMARSS